MTRSTIFAVLLALMTFAVAGYVVLAEAGVLAGPAEGIKITDIALVAATLALAWVTWLLAAATEGLVISAQKQDENSSSMAAAATAQSEAAKAQSDIAKGQLDSANAERAKNLGDQLFEFDKLLVQYPELQLKLEALRTSGNSFLASKQDADFVKLKSFIYMHLNFFDEIVSTYQGQSVDTVEYQDWCTYIVRKLHHPAFREVLDMEGEIFGKQLRNFFQENRSIIYATNGKPWLW